MKPITIKDVLHVLKLKANLLSVWHLVSKHLSVEFSDKGCFVMSLSQEEIAIIEEINTLYHIKFAKVHLKFVAFEQSNSNEDKLQLWHHRLGHLNVKSLETLSFMVTSMDLLQRHIIQLSLTCHGCIEGKQTLVPFPIEGTTHATKQLEIVHSNVCRPMKTMSMEATKYFVTFIDDFSRKIWIYPIKAKSECFDKFKEFKALVKKESKKEIKVFHLDNGGNFMSKQF